MMPVGIAVLLAAGPPAAAQTLTDLRIEGPPAVMENSTTDYIAIATFSNGDEFEVTLLSEWSVAPDDYAAIDQFGYLMTEEVPEDQDIVIQAVFTWDGVTETATLDVTIVDLTEDPEGDPWPEWQRNRFRWGRTSSKGPRTPRIQWSLQFDFSGSTSNQEGSMTLDADGRLFVPAREGLTCIDTVAREIL